MKKLFFLSAFLFLCSCNDSETLDCCCIGESKTIQFKGKFIIDAGDPYENFYNPNFKLYLKNDPDQNALIIGSDWDYSFKLSLPENNDLMYSITYLHGTDGLSDEGVFFSSEQLNLVESGNELLFDFVIPYP